MTCPTGAGGAVRYPRYRASPARQKPTYPGHLQATEAYIVPYRRIASRGRGETGPRTPCRDAVPDKRWTIWRGWRWGSCPAVLRGATATNRFRTNQKIGTKGHVLTLLQLPHASYRAQKRYLGQLFFPLSPLHFSFLLASVSII